MTIAQAIHELEVLAETGKLPAELVDVVREGLTLRESRADRRARFTMIVNQLKKLEVGPLDVLVLRLPTEVLDDPVQMRGVEKAAGEIASVVRRPVVMLQEDAPLTVEALPPEVQEMLRQPKSVIHTPPSLLLPPGVQPR